ncbi:Uncharacterised protein [Mycobacteroides abscessus subsp. massiliense]|nr:Uncharacterised protein [Mycobacteroides abscessus subsp. massiliense]
MLANVREWFGPRVKVLNHDIADAAVLALMGAFHLGEAMPFTVKERHYIGLGAAAWPN